MSKILTVVLGLTFAAFMSLSSPASAELILSQIIVDLGPDGPGREDIEAFNSGDERMYVTAEPFEIIGAGTEQEERVAIVDPERSGLFISPRKIILEPGERRIIRVAAIGPRPDVERVFRVSIKPVAGSVYATRSALKVFVGYDALVLLRPLEQKEDLSSTRELRELSIRNAGNSSVELFEGVQCNASGLDCRSLPGKRLYPGTTWQQTTPFETQARYTVAHGKEIDSRGF